MYDFIEDEEKRRMMQGMFPEDRTAGLRRAAGVQLPSDVLQQNPGMMGQMMEQFKSPMGMLGIGLTAATTDWDDPKSIGRGVGQLAGGAAGKVLGTKAGAELGGTLGSVVPGVGTILGAGLGAAGGSLLGGLFGDDEEEEMKKAKKQARMQQLLHNVRTAGQYMQDNNQARWQRMAG